MHTKRVIISILWCINVCYGNNTSNAFCSVPVADLLGGPIASFFTLPSKSTAQLYEHIPFSEGRGDYGSPRIAQLLFNQPVEIIMRTKDEVKIRVPGLYYGNGKKLHNTYWTQAHNITPLHKKLVHGVPLSAADTLIITHALRHPITKSVYSAGTVFKTTGKQTQHTCQVYSYNPTKKSIETVWIPKQVINRTSHKKDIRTTFITLLKKWTYPQHGFIPYVFGGCSISQPLTNPTFYTQKVTYTATKPCTFYTRPTDSYPHTGVDCARLFARAFQTLGKQWNAYNSKAFRMLLRPLTQQETPQKGDFIYFPGHIAVISDTKKGLLIEARSYQDGYGKVHEIPFSEQFEGIYTLQDIHKAAYTKKRVARLNNSGKKCQFIFLEILKFPY